MHWTTQLPGGLLARRYGTKLVYGLGNFLTALFGFLIPLMTHYHLYALVTLRVLQGLFAVSHILFFSLMMFTKKFGLLQLNYNFYNLLNLFVVQMKNEKVFDICLGCCMAFYAWHDCQMDPSEWEKQICQFLFG